MLLKSPKGRRRNRKILAVNIGCLVLLTLLFLLLDSQGRVMDSDMHVQQEVARSMIKVQETGEGTIRSGYPFLANLFFYAVEKNPLPFSNAQSWTISLLFALMITVLILHFLFRSSDTRWILPAITITTVLVHPVLLFARFDVLIMLVLLLLWNAQERSMYRASGALFVLAVFLKFSPLFLAPLLWFSTPKASRMRSVEGALASLLAIVLLAALTIGLPAFWQSSDHFLRMRGNHHVQVESTISGIDMLARQSFGGRAQIGQVNGDNASWNMDFPPHTTIFMVLIMIVGVFCIAFLWRRKLQNPKNFGQVLIIALLWMLFSTPVFSPQYQFWVLPLLMLWMVRKAQSQKRIDDFLLVIGILLYGIGLCSQGVYPYHWNEFITQSSIIPTILNNIRNFLLLGLIILLWKRPSADASA